MADVDLPVENTTDRVSNKDMCEREEMMFNILRMRVKTLLMEVDIVRNAKPCSEVNEYTIEMEKLLTNAENALISRDCDTAKDILVEAEVVREKLDIGSLKPKGTDVKVKPKESTKVSHRPELTVRGNIEDMVAAVQVAQAAFSAGNLEKAERFLLKAERIQPTSNAKELLQEVRAAMASKTEQNNVRVDTEDNVIDFESASECLKVVEREFLKGDYDKAERFLLKAQKFDPTVDVTIETNKISAAKRSSSGSAHRSADSSNNISQVQMKKDEADFYMDIAENAFRDGDFLRAESFIHKSERLYPSIGAQNLRKKIFDRANRDTATIAIKSNMHTENIVNEQHDVSYQNVIENNTENTEAKKIQSEKFIALAQKAISQNDIDLAEIYLNKAVDEYGSNEAKSLQIYIRDLKAKRSRRDYDNPSNGETEGSRSKKRREEVEMTCGTCVIL